MTSESLKSARLSAGRNAYLNPSNVNIDSENPNTSLVGPRPVDGSQPSCTANTMMSTSPTQNVGSEKPRMEPAMMSLLAFLSGNNPANIPSGTPRPTDISMARTAS